MFKLELDEQLLKKVVSEAVSAALEQTKPTSSLPPVLTRTQLMELLDIKSTKAAELFNRQDFPVTRELGHPRVLTHLLIQWLEDHTDWVGKNTGPAYFRKKGA
jgi:hypothetical protein